MRMKLVGEAGKARKQAAEVGRRCSGWRERRENKVGM